MAQTAPVVALTARTYVASLLSAFFGRSRLALDRAVKATEFVLRQQLRRCHRGRKPRVPAGFV